jgi:hypothetical protein
VTGSFDSLDMLGIDKNGHEEATRYSDVNAGGLDDGAVELSCLGDWGGS